MEGRERKERYFN